MVTLSAITMFMVLIANSNSARLTMTKDILISIKKSFLRNGFTQTLIILFHYLKMKKVNSSTYTFQFKPIQKSVTLRPSNSDFSVFRQVFMNGEYDLTIPIEPKVIIDAGANIGLSTLYFASRFPKAKIIAIEPSLENFEILQQQTAQISNVICCLGALWGKKEPLWLSNTHQDSWSIQVVSQLNNSARPSIQGFDLRSLIDEHEIQIIDLLKIDIEGSEWEVLHEMPEFWLKRTRIIVIELHENIRPGVELLFKKALESIQHEIYHLGENYVVINREL